MSYKNFANRSCEFYPCHFEGQNCLFCYCPLYWIPTHCGGKYIITPDGVKDCRDCLLPHQPGGWEHVQAKLREAFKSLQPFGKNASGRWERVIKAYATAWGEECNRYSGP
jgi:Zn-finger protein